MLRVGIDLGGTKTEGVVIDPAGKILERERRPTQQAEGYDSIVNTVCTLIRDLERRIGKSCHVGVGTPGSISMHTGTLKNSNTVCLNGKPLHTDLSQRLERPIRIANDANCFALAEALDGAGYGEPAVFGVILGTGVGGGIVINGKPMEGLHGIAGEWGHNVLDADGPACYCGKRGCVETLLSGPGFSRSYAQAGGESTLDAGAIVARAANGEPTAQTAMDRYIERFGRGLATVINILDPHVIVLGGGMSNIERLYTDGRDAVARHVISAYGHANATADTAGDPLRTRIVRNVHGDSAGVLGAAHLWRADE